MTLAVELVLVGAEIAIVVSGAVLILLARRF
jgi:hypothetical protein